MVLKWNPFLLISKKYKEDTIIIHEDETKVNLILRFLSRTVYIQKPVCLYKTCLDPFSFFWCYGIKRAQCGNC